MRLTYTADLWWKNAVVYCLDVETYKDGNGDGIGDFRGLTQQIDHLDRLGVTCIWLMPFFPSPSRDDGYDISDFYSVDPRLGTLGDFVEFMRTARDRGMRVIADLVVNHTSDEHPWFKESRSSRDSPKRDWYVWKDEPEPDDPKAIVFPDKEDSLWELDEKTGQYYYHSFYRFQPDLNTANPEVRDEIARILGFWMELGLSGFRVDAVPFLIEGIGGDPHEFLADLRAFMNRRDGTSILLGEVNLPYPELMRYFGDGNGDEVTLCFDFVAMQRFHLSMARQNARSLADTLRERPEPPDDAQWAMFMRNHDELTLDKLTDAERQEVFDAFGPDKEMQLYDRGLRRRLPPMLDGDQRRLKLAYSVLFSLPGTPVLFYGEEIGLGENLEAEGRMAVRIPMQWSSGGGFSPDPKTRVLPPSGRFGPREVNVEDQRRDPDSLLKWVTLLIERYRESPELAWGDYDVLDAGDDAVLALRADAEGGTVVTVHNFADRQVDVELTLDGLGHCDLLVDLLVDGTLDLPDDGRVRFSLEPYGTRWFRASVPEAAPEETSAKSS
ncbi:maltose alpha-D-glucosyltransferase/alpha-amylase [Streptosporangium becharense]|uniref:Maltose alpha-D-glucosyltransferase/alpha-amylase n=1 Tax=Streptosporangium becharense TaxID=1816182 RepID=A0A7W9II84_9ACTN|nr:alpha-amylase family protein [Streptosporangium becharense]MBB2914689.1 maltose alpha-D-glucosyltransferase/alpha-amylase [Streptosporangium becharense]MBB5820910.1 maltose alpha-D-glucosyltransferase/alpha-amylase [Streptosporangium becharense]